jgi:hypothetical protein
MTSDADATATEAFTAYLKSVVLPIIVIGPDGAAKPVGTGSIVGSLTNGQLLILTAKHNIDHIKKVDQRYGDRAHASMPDFFRAEVQKDQFVNNTECYLLFPFQKENKYSPIGKVVYAFEFDIALASCILPDGIEPPIPLAIDTNPPQVGMQGLAVGYVDMKAHTVQLLDENVRTGHWEFEGEFTPRPCAVTKAQPHGSSLCRWPCFQINVPIHSGMSGGPVINFPDNEHPAICGILASDLSINPDAQTEASGENALASALWISVALSMPVERGNGSKEIWTLLDLIENGIVKDFGTAHFELRATQDGRIEVIPTV